MEERLNPPQLAAVRHLDGPLLVLAGAGSGKTRVITRKIAHLLSAGGYRPSEVAAITFTNKAAREMQERAAQLLQGRDSKGLTVSTFHALGMRLLRAEASHAGLKPGFSIFDAADCQRILSDLTKSTDRKVLRILGATISRWKNALVPPDAALAAAESDEELTAARAFASYEATLRAYQAVDFDDLIGLPVTLLEREHEVLFRWQARLRYLLVDEYQDTNPSQYRLLRLLAGDRGAFTAVGDDDQAIYAFRGASVENLETLKTDYPRLTVIKLEQNYRSTVRILTAANRLISHNTKLYEKRLWSEHGNGDNLEVFAARDDETEAETVVMKLTAHRFQNRGKWSDYAILYRGNHQARLFEQYLRQEKVPYKVSGGTSFFERAEVKDIAAYLRLLANEDDDPAFIRAITTPRRGVGPQTLEALSAWAAQRRVSLFEALFDQGFEGRLADRQMGPLRDFGRFITNLQFRATREPAGRLIQELLTSIAYEGWLHDQEETRAAELRWRNVQDFAGWISRKGEEDGKNLLEIAQTVALLTMLDDKDGDADAVQLSTLHAAKGLEFHHVFLVGLEEGILPHREATDDTRLQEERRLMYVGITRAGRTLNLSWCEKRRRAGDWVSSEPSRFLEEIGQEGVRRAGKETVTKEHGSAQLARLKDMLKRPAGALPER